MFYIFFFFYAEFFPKYRGTKNVGQTAYRKVTILFFNKPKTFLNSQAWSKTNISKYKKNSLAVSCLFSQSRYYFSVYNDDEFPQSGKIELMHLQMYLVQKWKDF